MALCIMVLADARARASQRLQFFFAFKIQAAQCFIYTSLPRDAFFGHTKVTKKRELSPPSNIAICTKWQIKTIHAQFSMFKVNVWIIERKFELQEITCYFFRALLSSSRMCNFVISFKSISSYQVQSALKRIFLQKIKATHRENNKKILKSLFPVCNSGKKYHALSKNIQFITE